MDKHGRLNLIISGIVNIFSRHCHVDDSKRILISTLRKQSHAKFQSLFREHLLPYRKLYRLVTGDESIQVDIKEKDLISIWCTSVLKRLIADSMCYYNS